MLLLRCSRKKRSKNPSRGTLAMNTLAQFFLGKLQLSPQVGSVGLELGWLMHVDLVPYCSYQVVVEFR